MDRLQVLETRIENLRKGIAEMADGSTIQVNKSFLSNALKYMVELSEIRRAEPANAPLALDELRGMDGEPVWISESAPYTFAGYKILCSPVVDECEDVCFEGGDCYYSHDYGKTWLAYRTKPEGSAE